MQKFRLKIKNKTQLEVVVGFNEAEELVSVEVQVDSEHEFTDDQRTWLWQVMPKRQEELTVIMRHPNLSVEPIEDDLSFQRFWEAYDFKVGKKKRAIKLWEELPDLERHQAIKSIPRYNFFLIERGINKAYPETYLAQKRYQNEF
jgi:proteasome lid subunit RPN8/RPN11